MPLDLRSELARRPWWLGVALAVCLFNALILVPLDLFFTPLAKTEEVWFGITLHGWLSKGGELAHWVVWALGAWGLWHMRPWLPVAGGLYLLQVACAHVVWSVASPRGRGIAIGLVQGAVFTGLAILFLRSRAHFGRTPRVE
jgi:hypothetical protein